MPSVGPTGLASAIALAGRGATFVSTWSSRMALVAHLATMALDPRGGGTASAGLRACVRFVDASEREFWRARVSIAPAPSGARIS